MKKLISGLTALAIMAAAASPASAMFAAVPSADTTIEPTGGNPFDVTPNPESANATVEFDVNPKYMITVPALITLDGEYGQPYTGSGDITAENVFLHEDEAIIVTLTSASKFNMTNAGGGTYKLPYTATGFFGTVDKELGRAVARFETSTEKQTVTVSFATDETPKYAGKYSDPVVFGISVEKEAT
jgi:hypothetical protein